MLSGVLEPLVFSGSSKGPADAIQQGLFTSSIGEPLNFSRRHLQAGWQELQHAVCFKEAVSVSHRPAHQRWVVMGDAILIGVNCSVRLALKISQIQAPSKRDFPGFLCSFTTYPTGAGSSPISNSLIHKEKPRR